LKIRALGVLLLTGLLVSAGIVMRSRRGGHSPHGPARSSPVSGAQVTRLVLKIEGMGCIMCAAVLQNNLRALRGVRSAEVSFQDKQAVIDYDPRAAAVADLEKVVANSGFKVASPSP
jgi:copper chaperone CopZ